MVALLDDQEMNTTLRMSMQPVGYFQYGASNASSHLIALPEFKYLDMSKQIQWIGGKLPSAEPACGFRGEKCIYKTDWKFIGFLFFVSVIIGILVLFGLK